MLRELLAKFGIEVDDGALKKADAGIDKTKGKILDLGELASGLGGAFAGAALIGGVAHFTQGLIDLGSELDDQSNRLGISASELQGWRFVAGQAGASAEELGSGLKILTKNIADAAEGGAAAKEFAS